MSNIKIILIILLINICIYIPIGCSSSQTPAEAPPQKEYKFKEGEVIKFKATGERGIILRIWRYNTTSSYEIRYRTLERFRVDDFKEFELEKDDAKSDTKTN